MKGTFISSDLVVQESDKKETQNIKEETLKVRLNKDQVLFVPKEKLLEKSHYFKSITKSCFADFKSEFTEVSLPVTSDVFKQVIEYVSTDVINMNNDVIFEVFQISDYLQIECLSKMCLDHFIYNLNIKNLDEQLSMIESNPLVCKDFKEIALKFKESGSPSFAGLYLAEGCDGNNYIRLLNDNGDDHVIKLKKEVFSNCLHYISNSIVIQTTTTGQSLFQYDLITGKLFNINVMFSNESHICSENENVYLISRDDDHFNQNYNLSRQNDNLFSWNDNFLSRDDDDRYKLKVSVLYKTGDNEVLQVCKVNSFNVNKLVKHKEGENISGIILYFSMCYNEKLYIFYHPYTMNTSSKNYLLNYLQEIQMLTVCAKTLTVISNESLLERIKFNTGGVMTQKQKLSSIQVRSFLFRKLFFLKKQHKAFLEVNRFHNIVLVFDFKNQHFYFAENVLPISKDRLCLIYEVDKDDVVYIHERKRAPDQEGEEEIRAFHYRNNKLVDAFAPKRFIVKKDHSVFSFCVV